MLTSIPYSDFNPHSRVGSDGFFRCEYRCNINFNPHSRVGSDGNVGKYNGGHKYFNPHSRVGSDKFLQETFKILCISIHTPA